MPQHESETTRGCGWPRTSTCTGAWRVHILLTHNTQKFTSTIAPALTLHDAPTYYLNVPPPPAPPQPHTSPSPQPPSSIGYYDQAHKLMADLRRLIEAHESAVGRDYEARLHAQHQVCCTTHEHMHK